MPVTLYHLCGRSCSVLFHVISQFHDLPFSGACCTGVSLASNFETATWISISATRRITFVRLFDCCIMRMRHGWHIWESSDKDGRRSFIHSFDMLYHIINRHVKIGDFIMLSWWRRTIARQMALKFEAATSAGFPAPQTPWTILSWQRKTDYVVHSFIWWVASYFIWNM